MMLNHPSDYLESISQYQEISSHVCVRDIRHGVVLWIWCGVFTVGGIAASPEINEDAGVHRHSQSWMFPDPHLVLLLLGDLQRHDQHLNHRLPQRRVGGPAPSSLAVGLYCMLWQQVNQPSHSRHASTRTDLHTTSLRALIIYPACSHSLCSAGVGQII